jgi:UDP-glucuronate 4-epimerase
MSNQTILVTGAAGFIGFHVARQLLGQGLDVVGLDNLNAYYDPALKRSRLDILNQNPRFSFVRVDLADRAAASTFFA